MTLFVLQFSVTSFLLISILPRITPVSAWEYGGYAAVVLQRRTVYLLAVLKVCNST